MFSYPTAVGVKAGSMEMLLVRTQELTQMAWMGAQLSRFTPAWANVAEVCGLPRLDSCNDKPNKKESLQLIKST